MARNEMLTAQLWVAAQNLRDARNRMTVAGMRCAEAREAGVNAEVVRRWSRTMDEAIEELGTAIASVCLIADYGDEAAAASGGEAVRFGR